jgi:hypothetical protein
MNIRPPIRHYCEANTLKHKIMKTHTGEWILWISTEVTAIKHCPFCAQPLNRNHQEEE